MKIYKNINHSDCLFLMNSYDELFIMYNSYGTDDDDKFEINGKTKWKNIKIITE